MWSSQWFRRTVGISNTCVDTHDIARMRVLKMFASVPWGCAIMTEVSLTAVLLAYLQSGPAKSFFLLSVLAVAPAYMWDGAYVVLDV